MLRRVLPLETRTSLHQRPSSSVFLQLEISMPRNNGKQGRPHGKKPGTNNASQAAARDKRAADAAAAEQQDAAEALAMLDEPAPAPPEEQPSMEPEPACEPSKGEMDSYKRVAILSAYHRLNCPPESEWSKHGGTLRQFYYVRRQYIIKYGHFRGQTLYSIRLYIIR